MIADLHIHSKYSRATAKDCDMQHLDLWARRKGIDLVGTGDFTHPEWRKEMQAALVSDGAGLYTLREELRLQAGVAGEGPAPHFVVSGEISTIYKKDGRTRKVHHVILLPGLEEAEALAQRLEAIGNLHSDGRPILGLDSHDLLDIVLTCCPEAVYIPAHVWTPHFSLFGAFSGFETLEECYGDLTKHVRAVETGLSSDPVMNRRCSMLDGLTLVSNSDAHSPAKLGREANLLSCGRSYAALKRAIETGEGFDGTVEFFPEEGKYHLDGHRACAVCLEPARTQELGGRCPVCGRKLTIGVAHRVEELADRGEGEAKLTQPFESLMPLPELLADCMGASSASKRVQTEYFRLLSVLGPEFRILRQLPLDAVERAAGRAVAEALGRLRAGQVHKRAGYDGEYGVIRLFAPHELELLSGQTALVELDAPAAAEEKKHALRKEGMKQEIGRERAYALNERQQEAVQAQERTVAVIAGPGTGKTGTLVARIACLVEERGVPPQDITAVTFTNQAAQEMRQRLEERLGKRAAKALHVGTFHALSLELIGKKTLVGQGQAVQTLRELLKERGETLSASETQRRISLRKNGGQAELPEGLMEAYQQALAQEGARDLDDVLLEALETDTAGLRRFRHLLVDEFQDINAVQHELVRHWSERGELFVIGDADQSIYGFRGADAGCFDRLRAARPDLRCIRLEENYRSTPAILRSALAVIAHNPGQERVLRATRDEGVPVRVMTAADAFSEGVWIAKRIGQMVGGVGMLEARGEAAEARAFGEIAVLCRTRRQLEEIERCLQHDGIPCQVMSREAFWEEERVQGALALLRSLLDPGDGPALRTALTGLFGCTLGEALSVQDDWRDGGGDISAMQQEIREERLKRWAGIAAMLGGRVRKDRPRRLLEALADELGLAKDENMKKLLESAALYDSAQELTDALLMGQEADVRRLTGTKYPSGAVKLMTLHAAKGLEFPAVFVAGVNKGELPLEREGRKTDSAEERRLFFVGLTRAREELIVTCGGEPSVFLSELAPDAMRGSAPTRRRAERFVQLSLF